MGFEVDEEILEDFLVEAGEILEQLQEQLVELENNPENTDLLNAIFRGFHTVKGGAGFLSLTALVEACHGAENVFDIMRNGQRSVTSETMDVILQALDNINDMFASVQAREELTPAPPELIDALHRLSRPESEDEAPSVSDSDDAEVEFELADEPEDSSDTEFELDERIEDDSQDSSESGSIDEITEDEFEALLDELHGENSAPGKASESASSATDDAAIASPSVTSSEAGDDITDDEFEALLDELHGKGQFASKADTTGSTDSVANKPEPAQSTAASDDEISDDEFEALLDQLHGEGKGPGEAAAAKKTTAPAVKQDKPKPASAAEKPKAKPAEKPPAASAPKNEAKTPVPAPREDKKAATQAPAETTVRVDTKRLDQIMNMVGELVLVRNRLLSLGVNVNDEAMTKAIANLDVVTGDLQGAVMQTRMQPIKKVFGRFPRVVRDLARSLKKEITLELIGEETDLDKNLVEALADPLVHLVRNSVDHGIELPDERAAAGKPRMGTVKLSASQEGDHILLTIQDDGKGMDPEKLKEIAISKGVLDEEAASRMSDEEAFNLIFAPGFSTKVEISDISGRGVGMDVVKTKISQLNGSIQIRSEMGVGTTLAIKVPLTLAILPTLMVVVSEQAFALPLATVNEIINVDPSKTNTVDGQLTMIVRSKAIPLFYLAEWLTRKSGVVVDKNAGHVVVVQLGTQQIGFVVDSLVGQEEVVIKPLDSMLQGTPGMAGATITSDGGIALILDIPGLLKRYVRKTLNA
ncbi:chemotaxis protein CheA [Neptunicella marina]|uniref:Chemotaxis protein CheA n=1 Tax=Neptunicella marina TaxID=2125989 RepID=A0A8J6LW22_9ALTE|nr:chemotaxis protein CheA [Neptunicella marina]MBC3764979.1 chemotaxis protein CheA [Neptunicella marina]